jgi:hypothetical protein
VENEDLNKGDHGKEKDLWSPGIFCILCIIGNQTSQLEKKILGMLLNQSTSITLPSKKYMLRVNAKFFVHDSKYSIFDAILYYKNQLF